MNSISNNINKPGKTKAFFICILFALAFWLIHDLGKIKTIQTHVKIEYKNIPPFLIPVAELPNKIVMQVNGSGLKLLLNYLYLKKQITVDFNKITNLNHSNKIVLSKYLNNNTPYSLNLKILSVSPDTIYFAEPKGNQKNVIVKNNLNINCKPGYGIEIKEIIPKFITVYGSHNLLKSIDTVYTESVNLFDVDKSSTYNLNIIKISDSVYYSSNNLKVVTDVQRLVDKIVTLPLKIKDSKQFRSVNIYPNTVQVKYTLMQNDEFSSDSALFNAEVLIGKEKKHQVILTTKPSKAHVISIEPKMVELVLIK
ncbi:MAG: hypothetical protein LCH32_00280 [Bacteroidetes bacterium]|nr:hypothetical protein [Bacteroidota bacterium]